MATLTTSSGMIDPHSGSVGITSVALSDSGSSSCGSPPKTFSMRDLLNVARKTPSENGGSVMLQPSRSKKRIEKNVSTGSRHRMNRKEYEMIVGYLEDSEHLVDILGSGRKTKVFGKHPSKQTEFGVMAVHLALLGFPVCTSAIMQKKFDRYLASFKKAREWSMSTGAGLTEEEVTRGMTIEDKLNQRCPFYHRMYAIFGHRANIVPPATAEDGLLPEAEVEEDGLPLEAEEDSSVPITFLDSQGMSRPMEKKEVLGGEGDEIAHAETENYDNEFGDDGGAPNDETGRRLEEELEAQPGAQPFIHVQPSSVERLPRATSSSSQQTNEEVSNEAPTARRDGKRPAPRSNLISVYEAVVKEKTLHRKQIMESKQLFREQMLIERRKTRVQKERFLEEKVKESQKRARIDRRTSLLMELTKARKSVSEIQELFQGFLAEGLKRTSAGLGSVIIDSQPLTVAVLAALFLGENLGFVNYAVWHWEIWV
ncbi:hypothetical protein R1flu_013551 [Riccia fluitans]|uniref:Uncharacterized protein n=1 Tax=Riccia fluitans TaxID=41844 RepID=A0ABD1YDU5_9MARC